MEDVSHDGLVRHLGVVGVGVVDRIILPFTHVRGEWFAVVGIGSRVIGPTIVLDEILNERIGTSRVIRKVGQCQDSLVFANGKALDFAELRVLEFLAKFLQELFPAHLVVLAGHTEASHRFLQHGFGFFRK